MKGVLMKVGQMVSFIAEGLPDEAQQALAALQADAAPMAPIARRGRDRERARRRARSVCSRRGRTCPWPRRASARSTAPATRTGRELAVKVQFPGVAEAIEEDLDAAEVMYAVFSALALNGLDARALVDELRLRMREELDYRREAANIAEFAGRFAGHPWVRIPTLAPEFSTSKVLTTEWVDGLSWDQFVATASVPTKQRAAEVIWRFAQHSVHRVGVFNGDPHPGNYRFHHDGSVTFLDFGLVKRWEHGEWQRLEPTLDAIVVDRDPEALVAAMEAAGFLVPDHGSRPRSGCTTTCRRRTGRTSSDEFTFTRDWMRRHARPGRRHRRTLRRRHRQAEHAAELRDPRPGRVGRQRHPRQARGPRPVASRCCSSTAAARRRPPSSAPPS